MLGNTLFLVALLVLIVAPVLWLYLTICPVAAWFQYKNFRSLKTANWQDKRKNIWFKKFGVTITANSRDVKEILSQHNLKSGFYEWMGKIYPKTKGVIFLNGPEYQRQHDAILPLFKRDHYRDYTPYIFNLTQKNFSVIGEGPTPISDLYRFLIYNSIDLLFLLCFGKQAYHHEIFAQLKEQLYLYDSFHLSPLALRPQARAIEKSVKAILARQEYASDVNLITLLMQRHFSTDDIVSNVIHLYGAHKAPHVALTHTIVELARAPEFLATLRAECQRHPRVTTENMADFKNLKNCMKEILRMYPITSVLGRKLECPFRTNTEILPKGRDVYMMPLEINYDPEFWNEQNGFSSPFVFDPSRWAAINQENFFTVNGQFYAFVPFSYGKRACMGRELGILEYMSVLHFIVSHYRFEVQNRHLSIKSGVYPTYAQKIECVFEKI